MVGVSDSLKGQAPVAFITLKDLVEPSNDLEQELKSHVVKKIGAIARPSRIVFTRDLPENPQRQNHVPPPARYCRRAYLGRCTTLADKEIVEDLKKKYQED